MCIVSASAWRRRTPCAIRQRETRGTGEADGKCGDTLGQLSVKQTTGLNTSGFQQPAFAVAAPKLVNNHISSFYFYITLITPQKPKLWTFSGFSVVWSFLWGLEGFWSWDKNRQNGETVTSAGKPRWHIRGLQRVTSLSAGKSEHLFENHRLQKIYWMLKVQVFLSAIELRKPKIYKNPTSVGSGAMHVIKVNEVWVDFGIGVNKWIFA